MYGCEAWTISKQIQNRLEATEIWFLSRMLRIPWTAKKTNERVLNEANKRSSLVSTIRKRQATFLGHAMRRGKLEHLGYTALHLAAIHGHEHIIELLVQTFKADANLRDYSGKKAKQYLKNSASSKAQLQRLPSFKIPGAKTYRELLVSRRLGSDLHPVKSLDDSFIRSTSMRMSNRAKAISSLMQANSVVARQSLMRASWAGSNDDMREDDQERPSKSVESSPASGRKNQDRDLMPPPSNTMLARHMRHSERATSSSRERLQYSPNRKHKNDENQNFSRSGSDSSLKKNQDTIV
ncbi:ankyrin repeat domain-containing protein 57 [Plakobranchus ocellatus]|uniref:Ankyrin repeat domain-containing protein 57 n=1 Tax=Plakobranchus ocellatus TaxID=259542 RepID=A0AAV4AI54_9GAST|nr:ankyrin repeat domain-containing protein 57 [Plakobranchus ocellatus]